MDHSDRISILALGDWGQAEFRDARAHLTASGDVVDAATVDEAVGLLDAGRFAPAVVVVAESHPGEFSVDGLDRVRRSAPLARIVGLLGSWCEGEIRSGRPWPGVIRVYWHQWGAQAGRELAGLHGRGSWSLPSTASDEERLLIAAPHGVEPRNGLVALCVEQLETYDWLSEALARRGYSITWVRSGRTAGVDGAVAAVFDVPSAGEAWLARLGEVHAALGPSVPIVALVGFPRVEDHRRLRAAGAAAVLSKPVLVDDLYWQLDNI